MADLKNSKTAANLAYAFAGESQARNKYTYFASVARKEGYEQIAAIFEQTANNEKEHAKLWFKELGLLGDTAANLVAAAAGEHEEWTDMYKRRSCRRRFRGPLPQLRPRRRDRKAPRRALQEAAREHPERRSLRPQG